MRLGRIIAFSIGFLLIPALCGLAVARGSEPIKSLDEIRASLEHDGQWIDVDHWGTVWSPHGCE